MTLALPPWVRFAHGADAAEQLLHALAPERVRKQRPDPLTKPGLDTLTRQLARALIEQAAGAEDAAARRVRDLLDVNWARLSPKEQARVIAEAEKVIASVGPRVATPIADVLRARGADVIAMTREAAIDTWQLSIPVQVSEQDAAFVEHAAKAQELYVTNQYGQRASTFSAQARQITSAGVADGLDPATIGADLFAPLGSALGRTEGYFKNVASIFTARSRTASVLSSFEDAEITRYQINAVLDEATCFAPGTRILMGTGKSWKMIQNIEPGEMVMSCKGRPRVVKARLTAKTRTWGTLTLDGMATPLKLTPNHGVLTTKGWMRAGSLERGDTLALYRPEGEHGAASWLWGDERLWGMRRGRHDPRTIDMPPFPHAQIERAGIFAALKRVKWVTLGASPQSCVESYDLEVEEDAGYIAEGVVVHNSHICRALDGRTFEVAAARKAHNAVMEAPPEAVKELLPFVSDGRDDDGNTVMRIKRGDERITVGKVTESAVGRKDERGSFAGMMSDRELEANGVLMPPFHGHCRSLLTPVMDGYGDDNASTSTTVDVPEQIITPPAAPALPPTPSFAEQVAGGLTNEKAFGNGGINQISTALVNGQPVFVKPATSKAAGARTNFDPRDAVAMHEAVRRSAVELGLGEAIEPAALLTTAGEPAKFVTRSAPATRRVLAEMPAAAIAKIPEETRLSIALVDFLHRNTDRHANNVLVGADGSVTLIDHDRTHGHVPPTAFTEAKSVFFPKGHAGYAVPQKRFEELPEAAQRHVQRLADAAPAKLAKEFGITRGEAEAMRDRASSIVNMGLDKSLKLDRAKTIRDPDGPGSYIQTVGR